MNRYQLKNWSTKDIIIIDCVAWEIENYQHTFYQLDEDKKVVTQSYTTRYYVVENVEYNIT